MTMSKDEAIKKLDEAKQELDDHIRDFLEDPKVKALIADEQQRLANLPEGDFYCGWCLGHLIKGGCPNCDWIWVDLLTEKEAKVFQDACDLGADPDARNQKAWAAVDAYRKKTAT